MIKDKISDEDKKKAKEKGKVLREEIRRVNVSWIVNFKYC